jgi:hypothetical protein
VRLLQLVHVLGDFISDWDLVVDALEQMTACIAGVGAGVISSWGNNGHIEPGLPSGNYNGQSIKLVQDRSKLEFPISQTATPSNGPVPDADAEDHLPSPSEVAAVLDAIGRFRTYTCSMSDEGLVRLMTSLVTLSLNSFGANTIPITGMFNFFPYALWLVHIKE